MDDGLARQAGALVALLAALLRDGAPLPGLLATAGALGLVAYAALALGPALVRRLAAPPDAAAPPPEPAPPPPDAPLDLNA